MTLEDFFTLPELKDGLTDPTRVNDLLTIMQSQKESTVKTVSEATRQWSAVVATIAITENKECLDLFVRLNGLGFFDKWLNDAQQLVNDTGDGGLDELVIGLLRALERLVVGHHELVGSGVGQTVQDLVGHRSLAVREKAKDLCDRWAPAPKDVNSVENILVENVDQPACSDAVQQETVNEDVKTPEAVTEDENNNFKPESSPLMGTSGPLEDAEEKREFDSSTLTSSMDVDHALESATKTDTMEDKIDKDEEVMDGEESRSPARRNTETEFNAASGIGDSASGGGSGGSQESHGSENPKLSSNAESDDNDKKAAGIESDGDSGSHLPLTKPLTESQNVDLTSKRPSDMELDYGMVDPLELARQVAIEVELDVDSPEQSCSTSTKGSPEPEPGPYPKGSPGGQEPMNDSETLNPEKGFSGFDLNEEVSFDETEMSETDHLADPFSKPISAVSASRATAAVDTPALVPLQFEGVLGWKGAASTSAFRRIPEGEKTFSPLSSHNNSDQRSNRFGFDFDLNVAEDSEDKIQDFFLPRDFEEPSTPRLDLNNFGDSDRPQNRPKSSFISSTMQPPSRNTDLNLNGHLTFPNSASLSNPSHGKLFSNKRDESVISIFGTQVQINRKDKLPHPQPNGKLPEPSLDFNLGRPGSNWIGPSMPYSNLPTYGYDHNGFTMGPMYDPSGALGAPVPYMVDSRGAPIMPPIPPALSQPTQPFFFNMAATTAPSGSNGAGPSRTPLDHNFGFIMENRENSNLGLRQLFNHNQASSSSVIGGKRNEPDSGWELFPTNYKHHQQPPWQ